MPKVEAAETTRSFPRDHLNEQSTCFELYGRLVSHPCSVVIDSRRVSFGGGGLASGEGVGGGDNGSDENMYVIWRKCVLMGETETVRASRSLCPMNANPRPITKKRGIQVAHTTEGSKVTQVSLLGSEIKDWPMSAMEKG